MAVQHTDQLTKPASSKADQRPRPNYKTPNGWYNDDSRNNILSTLVQSMATESIPLLLPGLCNPIDGRRGSVVVNTPAWHAGDLGLIPGPADYILGVKTWLSTLQIVYLCVSRMRQLKAVGPFYLMSMPGEVKYPTLGKNV